MSLPFCVCVHVYADGDIELYSYRNPMSICLTQRPPKFLDENDDLVFQKEEDLRQELISYGAENDAISGALMELRMDPYATVTVR